MLLLGVRVVLHPSPAMIRKPGEASDGGRLGFSSRHDLVLMPTPGWLKMIKMPFLCSVPDSADGDTASFVIMGDGTRQPKCPPISK